MNLISTRPPKTIANTAIILIKQADYLLFRQLQKVSDKFIENCGFSEKMTAIRRNKRKF